MEIARVIAPTASPVGRRRPGRIQGAELFDEAVPCEPASTLTGQLLLWGALGDAV